MEKSKKELIKDLSYQIKYCKLGRDIGCLLTVNEAQLVIDSFKKTESLGKAFKKELQRHIKTFEYELITASKKAREDKEELLEALKGSQQLLAQTKKHRAANNYLKTKN